MELKELRELEAKLTPLTNDNYHSSEMRKRYMGFSQFEDFEECPVKAMAKINGADEEPTDAMLFGSWVDAHFSGEEEDFINKNRNRLYSAKTGQLYAAFKDVQKVINFIESYTNDEGEKPFLKYWSGNTQTIRTGIIAGVPVKIKMDSYFPRKCIADGKVMKDLEDVWVVKDGRNIKTNYIEARDYPMEGALYQEIERQTSGNPEERLPFVLNVATKEEITNGELVLIDQDIMDERLEYFKEKAPYYQKIKLGLIEPIGCGKCAECIKRKQVYAPKSYRKLYLEGKEEE